MGIKPKMITAAPTKLRNGEWGAKVSGSVKSGDSIRITTRSGKNWVCIVSHVLWSGDGVAIVATKKKPDTCRVGGRQYTRESGYCYYPCPVTRQVCSPENGPCHDCV